MSIITEIRHPSHPHKLKLMPVETPYCCHGCKNEGCCDSCYQCRDCGFYLHEECALGSPTFHPFFKERFLFYDRSLIDQGEHAGCCVACGKSVKGSRYQSLNPPHVFLHPCCLKLQTEIKDVDLGVNLKLTKKISRLSKCLQCDSRKLSQGVRGWAYESTRGNYRYHVACVKDLFLEKWKKAYLDKQITGTKPSERWLPKIKYVLQLIISERWLPKIKDFLQRIITAILDEGISVIIQFLFAVFMKMLYVLLKPLK